MKLKSFYLLILMVLINASVLVVYSCQVEFDYQEEASKELSEEAKIDKLLDALSPSLDAQTKKLGHFEAFFFEIVRNNNTGEISIENLRIEAYFPFIDIPSAKSAYQVYCDLGGEDDWNEGCNGIRSCGQLIKRCLDQGGCATVCENKGVQGDYSSVDVVYLDNLK